MARSEDEDLVWAAVGFVFGLYWFYHGLRKLKLRRIVTGMATSKARSIAMGTVEVSGRARRAVNLEDPIYRKPCAYYNIVVHEERGSGKRRRWVKIYESVSDQHPFFVEDETGQAAVYPGGAELFFEHDVNTTLGMLANVFSTRPPEMTRFIQSLPCSPAATLKIEARILRDGDPIYVLGHASAEEARPGLGEFLQQAARKLTRSMADLSRMLKADPVRMGLIDANRDGNVDAEEWDAGLAKFKSEMEQLHPGASAPPPQPSSAIAIRKSPDGLLILADKREDEFVWQLGTRAFFEVFGGPLLALFCGAYIGIRMKWLRF